MNIFLKKIFLALFVMSMLCSCIWGRNFIDVPLVKGEYFPVADIGYSNEGAEVAAMCQHGDFIGKRLGDKELMLEKAQSLKNASARPAPDGNGVMNTRYMREVRLYTNPTPPDDKRYHRTAWREDWGYTMNIRTGNDGIITECSATKQFLGVIAYY